MLLVKQIILIVCVLNLYLVLGGHDYNNDTDDDDDDDDGTTTGDWSLDVLQLLTMCENNETIKCC